MPSSYPKNGQLKIVSNLNEVSLGSKQLKNKQQVFPHHAAAR